MDFFSKFITVFHSFWIVTLFLRSFLEHLNEFELGVKFCSKFFNWKFLDPF
jgi:hypothetical protein